MKKLMIISIAILGMIYQNNAECVSKEGQKTKTVVAYYCDYGPGDCLKFKGNGDIWVKIPGILHTITIQVPVKNLVSAPSEGYHEYCTFFIFDPTPVQLTGIGLLDGCLHFKDNSSHFYYYELEEQTVITDYATWEQQNNQ